ncbi:hypothetical protein [Bradyrhizobium erythrophlei]|uniref:hypothetical protein n=1 Tax=Bradyrhizobium erythrophlei TaxID=1437360 RepID=UPI0009352BD5|nr:hypothetical protein [Bradyrhizobium erythrophlei]
MGDPSDFFNFEIRNSLNMIKATHIRLHLVAGTCSTAGLLASQIELYDVLLDELSEIQSSLSNYSEYDRRTLPASGRTA